MKYIIHHALTLVLTPYAVCHRFFFLEKNEILDKTRTRRRDEKYINVRFRVEFSRVYGHHMNMRGTLLAS